MTTHVETLTPVPEFQIEQPSLPTSHEERQTRKSQAMKIIHRYTLLAGGVGLIPAPFFDQVAIGGVLGKMLYDLSGIYGTKLTDHKAKALIAAVLGGAHAGWISYYVMNYLDKWAPSINPVSSVITRPIIAAAITYAIGRLFLHHFDTGAWLE